MYGSHLNEDLLYSLGLCLGSDLRRQPGAVIVPEHARVSEYFVGPGVPVVPCHVGHDSGGDGVRLPPMVSCSDSVLRQELQLPRLLAPALDSLCSGLGKALLEETLLLLRQGVACSCKEAPCWPAKHPHCWAPRARYSTCIKV